MRVQVWKRPAHRVDQHVGRLQVRRRIGMTRAPSLETRERIVFLFRAADFDQRMLRHATRRRLDARGFVGLLLVVRRPRRIAEAFLLVASGELEQRQQ